MREVNFSIPNVNKASVGITTALYDRRALDCTSTLPLINSLNHLAYLTTSSARIRDILTLDGGIERLVCILKQGRSKDMMEMWKWNLAFQCVVNIGIRGTEAVRTRVVEADMVPVIATILDNYVKVVDEIREKAEQARHKHTQEAQRNQRLAAKSSSAAAAPVRSSRPESDSPRASRRQGPPPSINVAATLAGAARSMAASGDATPVAATAQFTTSISARPGFQAHRHHHHRHHHHHHHHHHHRHTTPPERLSPTALSPRQNLAPLAPSTSPAESAAEPFVQPVRDTDRLASMMPVVGLSMSSQPSSPTTPLAPPPMRSPTRINLASGPTTRPRRRPSIRHQHLTAAESDDAQADSMQSDDAADTEMSGTTEMQPVVSIQDVQMEDADPILAGTSIALNTPLGSDTPHRETFDASVAHRRPDADRTMRDDDGNAVIPHVPHNPVIPTPPATAASLSPHHRPVLAHNPHSGPPAASVPRYIVDRLLTPNPEMLAAMPREEDVLMSLQLLAYVSKYCNLRKYFLASHLVPRLKIGKELRLFDGADPVALEAEMRADEDDDDDDDEEFLLPNDQNIFPLVEKFTVRHHTPDMQYWAGVVMRNLCRRDDARGGIRQCAYYQCGKWEEQPRQFAKCRRCRRTKYCSKECQKNAWAFHRHWCVAISHS